MNPRKFIEEYPDLHPVNNYVLSHVTYKDNLEKILESGYLKACETNDDEDDDYIEEENDDDFVCSANGTFYSLIAPTNKIKIKKLERRYIRPNFVILLFKPEILKEYESLFNPSWNYGNITDKTHLYTRFPEFNEEQNLQLNLRYMEYLIYHSKYGYHPMTGNILHEVNVYEVKDIPLDKYLVGIYIPEEVSGIEIREIKKKYPQYNFITQKWDKFKDYIEI